MSLQTHGKSDADADHDRGEQFGETFILRAELRLGKRTCVKHNDRFSPNNLLYLPLTTNNMIMHSHAYHLVSMLMS